MEIGINGETIDFALEKETLIGEVISALKKWAHEQNSCISALFLDKKEIYLHQEETWQSIPLDEVDRIDIQLISGEEQIIQDLEVLSNYFSLYERALKAKNKEMLMELAGEYPFVKDNASELLLINPFLLERHLFHPMEESGLLDGAPQDSFIPLLLEEWASFRVMIKGRILELADPWKEGSRVATSLLQMKDELTQVPLLFQQGKDSEALDRIIILAELLSKFYRVLSTKQKELENHERLREFSHSLKEILAELSQALENQDTILMGDLVEYEILERLDTMVELFKEAAEL